MKAGFTLIELLVVVLIIGILSAVALPQYETAVMKSRFATVLQTVTAFKTAEEAYFMANGAYTSGDPSKLDLSFDNCRYNSDTLVCDNYFFMDPLMGGGEVTDPASAHLRISYCPGVTSNYSACYAQADYNYWIWLDNSTNPGKRECVGQTEKGIRFCKTLH